MGIRLALRSRWSSGTTEELVYEFDQARVCIGRATGSDVCLPHDGVSGVHATLRAEGAGYVIQDDGSTNGTYVNKVRLAPGRPKPLRDGDRIELAGFVLAFTCGVPVVEATSTERTGALARRILREMLEPEAAAPASPRLLVLNGAEAGEALEVPAPPVRLLVGRGEECDLRLSDEDASREHAEIARDRDGVVVRDLSSKNGVLVNDRRVHEKRLRDRDELRIGATVLVFEDPAQAAALAVASAPDRAVVWPPEPDPPAPPEVQEEAGQGADDDASSAKADAPSATPPLAMGSNRRGGAGADVVIYLLAAAVLAVSVAGLYLLLTAG